MANVVEVILRAKDDLGGVNRFRQSLLSVKSLIGGLAVGVSFRAIIDNIAEAERATAKLDAAFKSTGATVGLTREQLDDLATSLQNTTTFGDDLVKEAESILLAFDKVRGEAFERTIKVAADLSARLGTDLTQNVRTLGLALQDPEDGFTRLTRAGIKLDDAQVALIKRFQSVGDVAGAQNVLLQALEKTYGGAASAARDTLGGALTGLKNAFGDLFEGTKQGTQGATDSINQLAKTLSDPSLKQGFDNLIISFTALASILAKTVGLITQLGTGIGSIFSGPSTVAGNFEKEISDTKRELDSLVKRREALNAYLQNSISIPSRTIEAKREDIKELDADILRIGNHLETLTIAYKRFNDESRTPSGEPSTSVPTFDVAPPPVNTAGGAFINPQTQLELQRNFDFLEEFAAENERLRNVTRTTTGQVAADYNDMIADIKKALDRGLIDEAQANAKRAEALKEANEKFLAIYKDSQKEIADENAELTALLQGAWEEVGRSIQNTLSDIFYTGEFSMRSLRDAVKRILADMLAAIVTSGIKNAIQDQFTGGSGNQNLLNSIFNIIGGFFGGAGSGSFGGTGAGGGFAPGAGGTSGYAATGGRASGMTWVGEEGPELVDFGAGATVYNARQLAFAGVGKQSISFAPQTSIVVQGNANDETITHLVQAMEFRMSRRFSEFKRSLALNGYEVR